jgi:Leucine-rich repeat (LRR) protein
LKYLILFFLSFSLLTAHAQTEADIVVVDSTQYDEVKSLLNFYKYMLNTVGSSNTSTRDKEVIITESYKKIFANSKVQIEDDLIEDRKVITNKDVNAYLRDVDFFFDEIDFSFQNIEIEKIAKGDDDFFYLISFESTIKGTTIDNETLASTKKRFIEVNLDKEAGDMKIASIYSTKVSRTKELQNWWSSLSFGWINIFKNYVEFDSITNQVLLKIASIDSLDISGNQFIQNLDPLTALKDLRTINISNTKIEDLSPLRYSRELKKIDASNSIVLNISSLQYFENLTSLNLSSSEVIDISILSRLKKLTSLNLSNTLVTDFSSLAELKSLKSIDLSNTSFSRTQLIANSTSLENVQLARTIITDLSPIKTLTNIKQLTISETGISDISSLSAHPNLEILTMNQTTVSTLDPLLKAPKLRKVYADNTGITEQIASSFMAQKSKTVVVANSEQVMQWWSTLPANWKNVFTSIIDETSPQKEDIIKLINRDSLDVSGKNLFELEPLQKFKRLKYLNVSNNLFTNFGFTQGMTDLTFLNGERLPIENTQGLEKNLNLRFLILKGSLLKDIKSLSYLNKLELIDADKTGLKETQVAEYLQTNSKTVVIYRSEKLKAWWDGLPEVWKKELKPKEIDTYYLHELTQGEKVSVSGLSITSLEPLNVFNNLKRIQLNQVRIANLNDLNIHKNLSEVICTNGPLQSLEGITQLRKLESLNISNTAIEDLKDLDGLTSLKNLNCSGTPIKNLKGIEGLYQMESIDFSNTRVWKLERLYGMNKLKRLVCNNTRLRDHTIEDFQDVFPDCEITFY